MGVLTLAMGLGKEEVGQCFVCVWFGFVDLNTPFKTDLEKKK